MGSVKFFVFVFLISVLLLVAVLFACNLGLTIAHEEAHKQVFREFGVDSNIQYSRLGLSGATIPSTAGISKLSSGERMTLSALEEANEVYGYQVFTIVLTVFGFSAVQLFFLFSALVVKK